MGQYSTIDSWAGCSMLILEILKMSRFLKCGFWKMDPGDRKMVLVLLNGEIIKIEKINISVKTGNRTKFVQEFLLPWNCKIWLWVWFPYNFFNTESIKDTKQIVYWGDFWFLNTLRWLKIDDWIWSPFRLSIIYATKKKNKKNFDRSKILLFEKLFFYKY